MKKLFVAALVMMTAMSMQAQRVIQPLGRGVVAVKNGTDMLVSWRKLAQEPEKAKYNVYVKTSGGSFVKLNGSPLSKTNYKTTSSTLPSGSQVAVSLVRPDGTEGPLSQPYTVKTYSWNNVVADVTFESTVLNQSDYRSTFAYPADLDGDGEYEYVIDRLHTAYNSDFSATKKLQAYKADGTCLWTLDMGPNVSIDAGQSDLVTVYDINCDGKAEVLIKSSDGTRFWDAANNTWGAYVNGSATGDTDGDGITDYRQNSSKNPPFYISVVNGETGAEITSAELNYSEVKDGSDQYSRTNRSSYKTDNYGTEYAFLTGHFAIAYEDGIHPSLMMEVCDRTTNGTHHYYILGWGYDWDGNTPSNFAHQFTLSSNSQSPWLAQFHQVRVCDVDGDGIDELLNGGGGVNMRDGMVMNASIGHGDRFRVSDINPERPGLEVYAIQQSALLGQLLYDAATGEHIKEWYLSAVGDVGRGECMDVDPNHKGYEIYSTMGNLYSCEGDVIQSGETSYPYEGVWWDGDLDREALSTHGGSGWNSNAMITQYNGTRLIQFSKESGYVTHTANANRPLFFGDIMGDWREEVVLAKQNDASSTGFVVYSTNIETNYSFYCLQQDPHYRGDCSTRGYYQSPNTGFYLGYDMPLPPLPPVMTADVSYKNGDWSASLANGKTILFDLTGQNSATININSVVTPDTTFFMTPKGHDYTFAGSGKIGGKGDIWKSMLGTVTLQNGMATTGTTYISEGMLLVNGAIAGPVDLRARGTLAGNATLSDSLILEGALNYEGGRLMPGETIGAIGTITLSKGLNVSKRLFMEMDIDATATDQTADLIQVNGDLKVTADAVFTINCAQDTIQPGKYKLIAYTGAFSGDLSNFSARGLTGLYYEFVNEDNAIYLVINEQRKPENGVIWNGAVSNEWNYSEENFLLNEQNTTFVSNDSIIFPDDAEQFAVSVPELMPIGSATFTNDTQTYTLSGDGGFSGTGGLTFNGQGKVILNATKSDYTGATIINAGTVTVKELANAGTPSSFGAASANAKNWQMGKAKLIVNNTSAATDRALTLNDSATIQNGSGALTLQGAVKGTGTLIKAGGGQLSLMSSSNTYSGGTVINAGTLAMGAWNATFGTSTSKITGNGGTLVIFDNNSTSAVPTFTNKLEIPSGKTLTVRGGSRCKVGGTLLGAGTMKISFPYVRGDFYTNCSAFEGTVEVTSGQFRLSQSLDLSNATFQPDAGVYVAGVKSQSGTETAYTHKIGALQSTATDATMATGTWNVGYLGTDTKFASAFNSSATLNKYGDGTLTLTGASAAKMNVNEGALSLENSSAETTSALVTVNSGAMVCGTGETASITVNNGGTLAAGKRSNTVCGTLTLTGNLTVKDGAYIRVRGRSTSRVDQFKVDGKVTLTSPVFQLSRLAGDWTVGTDYKVFDCSSITLNGTPTFEPAEPIAGYIWDYSRLESEGVITIVADPVGIHGIEADGQKQDIYDLSGRKVSNASAHGIYIINGKKIAK